MSADILTAKLVNKNDLKLIGTPPEREWTSFDTKLEIYISGKGVDQFCLQNLKNLSTKGIFPAGMQEILVELFH